MKRFLSFFLILILIASISQASVSAWELVDFMRIGIYYGSNARGEYTLTSDDGFDIGYYEGRTFVKQTECYANQVRIVSGGGNTLNAVISQTGEVIYSFDTSQYGLGVEPKADNQDVKIIKITAKATASYRGGFDFKASAGSITAINVVMLDDYLYGVISREMSPTWPKEALKAQAVCARNFALRNKAYDSISTPRSEHFGAISLTLPFCS